MTVRWQKWNQTEWKQNDKQPKNRQKKRKKKEMFPARLELATFRVLGGRDNHYTTETSAATNAEINGFNTLDIVFSPARAQLIPRSGILELF